MTPMNDKVIAIRERIKTLEAEEGDFAALLKEMRALAALAPVSIGAVYEPGATLYRGTNHHTSIPSRIDEIWFPPANGLRSFGRANRPGSPMFYCCSDPNGAFREIGAKLGQYAVLATWVTVERMVLHEVGYSPEVLERAGATRSLPERHAAFRESLSSDARDVKDFLALVFTDPTASHYRITASIAEMSLACDGVSGIMYPSVEKSANVDNLALLPQFVRSGLKLTSASAVFVNDVTADGIGGAVVARLTGTSDGNLVWEYPALSATDIPPHSGVTMRLLPGQRTGVTREGQLQINGRLFNVRPGYSIELAGDEVVVRDLQGSCIAPVSL